MKLCTVGDNGVLVPVIGKEYRNALELRRAMRDKPDEFVAITQYVLVRTSKILQRKEERVSRVVEVTAKKGGFFKKPIKKAPADKTEASRGALAGD